MQATIKREGDLTVVYLQGYLDFESADPFRLTCLRDFADKKIIFNLKGLSFVGSSGITTFIQTMEELRRRNGKMMKFCAVGSEFRRVFATSEVCDIDIFEHESQARLAFQTTQIPTLLEKSDVMQPPDVTLSEQIRSAELFRKQST